VVQHLPQEKRHYNLSNQVILVPLDMEIMVVLAHLELLHTSLEVEVVPVVLDNLDLQNQVVGMVD
tara:strand:- start:114 stop:308 length:195 start_codon:yes stop_codon:yes gene_type:complete